MKSYSDFLPQSGRICPTQSSGKDKLTQLRVIGYSPPKTLWEGSFSENEFSIPCREADRSCPARLGGGDRSGSNGPRYHHPDQAPGGYLPRESLVRCVLRHIPGGGQPTRATRVPRTSGNAIGQRAHTGLARSESELIESIPHRSAAVVHLRPGPRIHSRAAGTQR